MKKIVLITTIGLLACSQPVPAQESPRQINQQMNELGKKMEVLGKEMETEGNQIEKLVKLTLHTENVDAETKLKRIETSMEARGKQMEVLGKKMEILGKKMEKIQQKLYKYLVTEWAKDKIIASKNGEISFIIEKGFIRVNKKILDPAQTTKYIKEIEKMLEITFTDQTNIYFKGEIYDDFDGDLRIIGTNNHHYE